MGLNASTMCHEARCIDKKSPCNTKSKPQMKQQARHIVPVKPKLAVQLHRVHISRVLWNLHTGINTHSVQ